MVRLSRPVVYTFVTAVAVYAGFLLIRPDAPPRKHVVRAARPPRAANVGDFTAADAAARFDRYSPGKRDPFLPVIRTTSRAAAGNGPEKTPGGWALTGINLINGISDAVVENSGTGDSAILQQGDRWNGLRVVSIRPDSVVFQNALGQQTHLGFPLLDVPDVPAASASPGARPGGVPVLPGLGSHMVPPMPVLGVRSMTSAHGPQGSVSP